MKKETEKDEKEEKQEKQEKQDNQEKKGKKEKEEYDDYELNEMEYYEAVIYDKRSLLQTYWATLKREHFVIFTFISKNDFNLFYVKIERFFILICTELTMNGMFFVHERMYKKKTGANTKLVIVGKKAWLYKEILEEASNDKDIVLTGYVPKCDLVDLLNEAKGFVYPSYFEGFGIPPLEALSCGTPVAVSDIDVMREVLGDVVIYFDPYDEKDIASALKRLITEDKISQIKRIDIHTWGQSAEQLKKVYMKTNNGG